jgi:hypothetical protein
MIPTLTPELIDTMKEGDRVMIEDPATKQLVEFIFSEMSSNGKRHVFFTTADSQITEYNRNSANLSYTDCIKHIRGIRERSAARLPEMMKSLIESKQYRIG